MAGAHFTIDTSGLRQIQERVQVMAFQFNPRPPLLAGESGNPPQVCRNGGEHREGSHQEPALHC